MKEMPKTKEEFDYVVRMLIERGILRSEDGGVTVALSETSRTALKQMPRDIVHDIANPRVKAHDKFAVLASNILLECGFEPLALQGGDCNAEITVLASFLQVDFKKYQQGAKRAG